MTTGHTSRPDAAHLAKMEQPESITQAILDYMSPVVREAR
jgi:hypothetical protein